MYGSGSSVNEVFNAMAMLHHRSLLLSGSKNKDTVDKIRTKSYLDSDHSLRGRRSAVCVL